MLVADVPHDPDPNTADTDAPRAAAASRGFRPVVFLSGLLCDQGVWRAQVQALADVAATGVPALTLDDSVGRMASRVLAAAPPRFALVGLSMGGYVALEVMRQAPERVTRLALLDTSARPDTPERAAQRRAGLASLDRGRFAGVTGPVLRRLVHPDRMSGPVGDELRAMAARVGAPAFLRQQHAILARPDARPGLGRIAVPTLVGVGDSDAVTPPDDARELQRSIPEAVLHVFERCGHLPVIEQLAAASAVLRRWLCGADL